MFARRALVIVCLLASARVAGAHAIGTVFSSPVDADGVALYWNPAAMSLAPTSLVQVVGNVSIPQATYQRYGIDTAQTGRPFPQIGFTVASPEPALGIIIDRLWHKRLRLGLSVTVPNSSGAAWPGEANDMGQQVLGPTRYHVTDAVIFHLHVQVGASVQVHRTLAIGASVNVVYSRLDVYQHLDLANQAALSDVIACSTNPIGCENPAVSLPVHFLANGVSAGASLGVLWRPIPRLRIGASYISPVKVPLAVSITVDTKKLNDFVKQFAPGFTGISLNGDGTGVVTVPQRFHFAVAVDVHPRIELMAMFRWINVSATEIITGVVTKKSSSLVPDTLAIPSVHNDEWMVSARILGRIKERTKLAFSLEYVTKAVPDAYATPANLDFDTISFNLAANVRVWKKLYLGASFSQFIVVPRTITKSAVSNESPPPYNLPDPTGSYVANSERIGLDVTGAF